MASELKNGDRVRSKSGGPLMTIFRIIANETAYCRWHDGEKSEWGVFHLSSLVCGR